MNLIASTDTIELPAVPRAGREITQLPALAVPTLNFPKLFIIAPVVIGLGLSERDGDDDLSMISETYCALRRAVYNLESVPALVFDAWLKEILGQAQIEACLVANPERLADIGERWFIINELAERGLVLPLYDSQGKARNALRARQGGKA